MSNKLKIVYADDYEDYRDLVALGAFERGHQIETFANGTELLRRLADGPGDVDVIVTDNDMPGGPSGLEILVRLSRDERFEHTPIVLYSANRSAELSARVAELHATFVAKVQVPEDLFDVLDSIVVGKP